MLARWIAGQDVEGFHYLIHTARPRFIARLAEFAADPADDIKIELSSGEVLCEFQWIDPAPTKESELAALMLAANDALDELDEVAIDETEVYDAGIAREAREQFERPTKN